MAIHEHDREDLLRDGHQMPSRGQCSIDGEVVLCGFRTGNQLSLYCGQDPVFQFNDQQQLRRVFLEGRKFAAENGELLELKRSRKGGRVVLIRDAVDPETLASIMNSLRHWIELIQNALESAPQAWRIATADAGTREQSGHTSLHEETRLFHARLSDWIATLPDHPPIALSANA